MIKSTQIKIILIVVLLAIIMFGVYGVYSILTLQNLETQVIEKETVYTQTNNFRIVFGIITVAFILISFIILWFARKTISQPILRLIQSAKQINETPTETNKNEIDELSNAIDVMNTDLK